MNKNYDVIIAGTGAGGCFTALTKDEIEKAYKPLEKMLELSK